MEQRLLIKISNQSVLWRKQIRIKLLELSDGDAPLTQRGTIGAGSASWPGNMMNT
jgi:hypothetical protein